MNVRSCIAPLAIMWVASCGPTIVDRHRLPSTIALCGSEWEVNLDMQPMTREQAAAFVKGEPLIFDITSGTCPPAACSLADLGVPPAQRRPCQELIWARVGWDAYLPYGIPHLL
jgi:hypothetical protein